MPKGFDESAIKIYFDRGMSDKQIAKAMKKTAKNAYRTVQRIRLKNGWKRIGEEDPSIDGGKKALDETKRIAKLDFSDMTFRERMEYLRGKFKDSSRFRYTFDTLDKDEQAVFQEEYFNILSTMDDLTLAEEQSLFLAVYELVLALKTRKKIKEQEDIIKMVKDKKITKNDPGYITTVNEQHSREYKDHMNSYREYIKSLKLSRSERLKNIKDTKRSFADYINEVSTRDAQKGIVATIKELNKKRDEELERLLKEGLILGYFQNDF